MKKQSMTVEGFKITAWKDAAGLMRMEIKSTRGKEVLHNLDIPWERAGNDYERLAFTDNEGVVKCLIGADTPSHLRRWAKDPVFRAWFKTHQCGMLGDPMERAARIEASRRREGRDPETGAMLCGEGELARPAFGGA